MEYEIIDFHTHPYKNVQQCTCIHQSAIKISIDETLKVMDNSGVSLFCGSVLTRELPKTPEEAWEILKGYNKDAAILADYYKGRYLPGIHVHPYFAKESISEIEKYHEHGVKIIGELVPWRYCHNNLYCTGGMDEILDFASSKKMVLSIHPTTPDDMDKLCENHPNLIIVGAHPGEGEQFERHVLRAKKYKNYYVDLSGSGIHRYGATKRLVDEIGVDKVIFGSDYAIANLQMYVDGVLNDHLLTAEEKRLIFADNAKRILDI